MRLHLLGSMPGPAYTDIRVPVNGVKTTGAFALGIDPVVVIVPVVPACNTVLRAKETGIIKVGWNGIPCIMKTKWRMNDSCSPIYPYEVGWRGRVGGIRCIGTEIPPQPAAELLQRFRKEVMETGSRITLYSH